MKKLPVGRQNFKEIITQNLLYVDKTRQVYELIQEGKLYFLSRPRRFGKSLLVSVFRYLFEGEKEVFQELYIGKETDYEWGSYPVIQFNLAAFGHEVENLEELLSEKLQDFARQYEVNISSSSLSVQFQKLIEQIAQKTGKPVVILIDEYDKPIIDFFTEIEKARINQGVLRAFFSPLKELDSNGFIHFLFITGVSKFSKVSLFSDLNNLTDLSMDPISKDLLGITHEELLSYFSEYISEAARQFQVSEQELLDGVKLWYNGYSFDGEVRLYNPFSLLNFFRKKDFGNFWFATGTPTFLVNSIRDRAIDPQGYEDIAVPAGFFDKFSLQHLDMTGLLYQTGYLTISRVVKKGFKSQYFLSYPNVEVKHSLMYNLLEAFTHQSPSIVGNALLKMERSLEEGKLELFINNLKVLLSDISYHLLPRSKQQSEKSDFEVWEG